MILNSKGWLVGEVERLRAEPSLDPPEPEREPEAQRPTCVGACDGAVSVAGMRRLLRRELPHEVWCGACLDAFEDALRDARGEL